MATNIGCFSDTPLSQRHGGRWTIDVIAVEAGQFCSGWEGAAVPQQQTTGVGHFFWAFFSRGHPKFQKKLL